ncbi:hypothetical protein PoB_002618400 [Plakobranchus ocellatus]|uniref:FAD-binding PCMH-type domain-containing protein n=1 Tax=Plakobranchus ocellatus TaxID=259542 RepID=A0AAV3ZZ74_9GAST|nr:hypothetical protein PoB_002618400 [Plakobranchus ocellatus]
MRAAHFVLLGCALLGAVTAHTRQDKIPPNRCLPGQNCFPSRQILKEFAATLSGELLQPFDAGYSVVVNLNNARLTRHPYLIVMAESVSDVQRSMKFARKYQLMVFSQVSVNGASPRSTYDGAMQINLSRMTTVSGLVNNTLRSEFGEVTAQAGASWDSVYSQARTIGRDVVTGDDINYPVGDTVGNGAIGPLVKVYGLVTDSLLEVQIVTADGSLVTVDEYNVEVNFGDGLQRRTFDKSLFAAIAEGGIGPWGIVVSYTFKLHPAPAGYDKILATEDGGEKFSDVLLFALNNPTLESSFGCYGQLLGGASLTPARNHSYVNPALRTSYLLLSCALGWEGSGLEDSYYIDHALDYAAMFAPYTNGKYLGWHEEDLADWKHQLHGDNYADLIDVKIRYDIDNFLWCPNCVGSDFRVDCRYNNHHQGLMLSGYLASHRQEMRMRRRQMSRLQSDHEVRHPYISMMSMKD